MFYDKDCLNSDASFFEWCDENGYEPCQASYDIFHAFDDDEYIDPEELVQIDETYEDDFDERGY